MPRASRPAHQHFVIGGGQFMPPLTALQQQTRNLVLRLTRGLLLDGRLTQANLRTARSARRCPETPSTRQVVAFEPRL
jgi:hypothetical protein